MSISNLKLTITEQLLILKQKLVGTQKNQVRTLCIVGLLILIAGIVTLVVWFPKHEVDCHKNPNSTCIINEAKNNLGPQDVKKLEPVVRKIQGTNYYEQNPNLLYIMTIYYFNKGEGAKAKTYYDSLAASYDSNTGLDKELGGTSVDIYGLGKSIELLQHPSVDADSHPNSVRPL